MKLKYLSLPLILGSFALTLSCGEKKADKAVSDDKTEVDGSLSAEVDGSSSVGEKEVIPNVSLEEIAKVTGFAQNLPADIEGYLSFINTGDSYDQLLNTKLGVLFKDAASASGESLEEMEDHPEVQMLRAIFGEEVFLAFGNNAGAQGANLQQLNVNMSEGMGKMMVQTLAQELQGDDGPPAMMMNPLGMFGEPKDLIDLIANSQLPPITVGLKVSDEDMREQIIGMIAGQLASVLEFGVPGLEELALEKEGVKLSGFNISGKALAEMMEEGREDVSQMIGGDNEFDRLKAAIAARNIYIATGSLGDHVLVYLGDSLDGFKFSEGLDDSLLSHKGADFLKLYGKKDIRMMSFIEEGALRKISSGVDILASIARGAQSGLAESEVFGDTRDVQTLLGEVAKLEGELFGMNTYSSQGWVGFIEDGFKVESHGGASVAQADLDTPHTFTSLASQEDVFLYANAVGNPEFSAKLTKYLETITETAHLAAKQLNDLDLDDPDFQEFKSQFDLFDQLAAKDLATLWTALSGDFAGGTGAESALVIDLKGTLPKIPDVPAVALEKGVAPRIALVMPVEDRAKLKSAWSKVNAAVSNILKNANEAGLLPNEIPMQEPLDSEKYGLSTYFFAIPTTTKDVNPNISLNDDLFIASSSPTLNGEIVSALQQPQTVSRRGSYLKVNFSEAQEFLAGWLKLAEENQDEFFESDDQKEDFAENLPMMKTALEALNELDSYTLHTRKIAGEPRSSHHFKMK